MAYFLSSTESQYIEADRTNSWILKISFDVCKSKGGLAQVCDVINWRFALSCTDLRTRKCDYFLPTTKNLWFVRFNKHFNLGKTLWLSTSTIQKLWQVDREGIWVRMKIRKPFVCFNKLYLKKKRKICCVYSINCECFSFHKPQTDFTWMWKKLY